MFGDNRAQATDPLPLSLFELPRPFVELAVRSCRLVNTALDAVFYDVSALTAGMAALDRQAQAADAVPPSRVISFDALSNPEGSLLLIDPETVPFVHEFRDVETFLSSPLPQARSVTIASISGVGSSALGSAALAWDIASALREPVLAIVPGYGVADVVLQGLGGWFGFGLYNKLHAKSLVQNALANVAPRTASIGRALSASTPDSLSIHGGPIFRSGSGSSDVLHALMTYREAPFRTLVGHSKGALQIKNALQSLAPSQTHGVQVVTLGCPVKPDVEGVTFHQYLGLYDALGQLNAWGNRPTEWLPTWHTTNPALPPAMDAGKLTLEAARPE